MIEDRRVSVKDGDESALFNLFLRYNTDVRGEASGDAGAQQRCARTGSGSGGGVRSEARGG
jgi:hypothetical protein